MPRGRRTTARSILAFLVLWAATGTANAAVPERILFPVVGKVTFTDDFGAPRAGHSHRGNDIMAAKKSPVVAVEAGHIEKPRWLRSDCLLILHGDSGTDYWYLHLNNDLTMANDNLGGCRNGTSYAPDLVNGQRVRAGQLIGYVGNSGNANWAPPHLHFELHPDGGPAVSPYAWLIKAPRLLFAVPGNVREVRLALHGRYRAADEHLAIRVLSVRVVGISRTRARTRTVALSYGPDLVVDRVTLGVATQSSLTAAVAGQRATAVTPSFEPTLTTQLARRGVLSATRLILR